MLKLVYLQNIALSILDAVDNVIYTDWDDRNSPHPIEPYKNKALFIIHRQTGQYDKLVTAKQNYRINMTLVSDILFKWPRYDDDIDFSAIDSVVEEVLEKLELKTTYTKGSFKQIRHEKLRSYFDRPNERFGVTVTTRYNFIDNLTKLKWKEVYLRWNQITKSFSNI